MHAEEEEGHASHTVADEADEAPIAESTLGHQEPVSEEQSEIDPEIEENQRQLEEYLRGEGFYEDQTAPQAHDEVEDSTAAVGSHEAAADEAEPAHAAEEVPREDVTSPKPPSRPPSTRPPVPKTSLPPPPGTSEHDDNLARVSSPSGEVAPPRRGSLIPPVPTTVLPTPLEAAAEEEALSTTSQAGAGRKKRLRAPFLLLLGQGWQSPLKTQRTRRC